MTPLPHFMPTTPVITTITNVQRAPNSQAQQAVPATAIDKRPAHEQRADMLALEKMSGLLMFNVRWLQYAEDGLLTGKKMEIRR